MVIEVKLIEITCPYCKRFLAYVRPDSDVFCPRCRKYVYMGIDSGNSKGTATSTAQG